MRNYFLIILAGGILLSACSQVDAIAPKSPTAVSDVGRNHDGTLGKVATFAPGEVIDDFNDGVISDTWSAYASDNARVYEANGVLNIDVGAGRRVDGGNQVAGIGSKEFILRGDFDIQVEFQLSPDYHSTPQANTKFIVVDDQKDLIEISVRTGHYTTLELPFGGAFTRYGFTRTDQLSGKLRIERVGNTVATYYWRDGWRRLGQWSPTHVTGDLKVAIDSWNWTPDFLAFSTKFDNLLSSSDGTPPETTISSAVDGTGAAMLDGGLTLSTSATLTFAGSDDVGVVGFRCSLDGSAYASCITPLVLSGMAIGSHTVRVSALDAAGNLDLSPARFTWVVVTPAQAIQNLITSIASMGLPAGVANSLIAPLGNINTDNQPTTCGKLGAFNNQVNAKLQNGQLTAEQVSQLLQAARAIVASMDC